MKHFQTILFPLDPTVSKGRRIELLRTALNAAEWFKGELIIAVQETELSEAISDVSRLRESFSTQELKEIIPLHDPFSDELLCAIQDYDAKLLHLLSGPKNHRLKPEQEELLKRSWVPILITPPKLTKMPFSSLFVPVSGERTVNPALELALNIATEMRIPVDILHVTEASPSRAAEEDVSGVGRLGDEFHHEYPRLIDELIAETAPYTDPKERLAIRHFWHVYGATEEEVLSHITRLGRSLTILDWKGILTPGRARTLKRILANSDQSLLLVRSTLRAGSTLKVGKDFHAA